MEEEQMNTIYDRWPTKSLTDNYPASNIYRISIVHFPIFDKTPHQNFQTAPASESRHAEVL